MASITYQCYEWKSLAFELWMQVTGYAGRAGNVGNRNRILTRLEWVLNSIKNIGKAEFVCDKQSSLKVVDNNL